MRIGLVVFSLLASVGCLGRNSVYTDADRSVLEAKPVKILVPVCLEDVRPSGAGGIWTSVLIHADGSGGEVQAQEAVGPNGTSAHEYTQAVKRYSCDEAVIAAVKRWRFKPAEKDGRPVTYRMRVGVAFDFKRSDS